MTFNWLALMRHASIVPLARHLRIYAHELDAGAAVLCPTDCTSWAHVAPDGRRWRCRRCRAGGSALDFLSYYLRGQRYRRLDHSGKAEVRRACSVYLDSVQYGPIVERKTSRLTQAVEVA